MVTAETLTDEMIRAFRDSGYDRSTAMSVAIRRALTVVERKGSNRARMAARARIAAAINARKGK